MVPDQVTRERIAELDTVLALTTGWAQARPDIRAVGLVGSWARGQARMDSDADLTVLTNCHDIYVTDTTWIGEAAGTAAVLKWTKQWGSLTERRVALPSGFEIEYGFAPTSWANIEPLDGGTASVVSEGLCIVYDPDGLLARIVVVLDQV